MSRLFRQLLYRLLVDIFSLATLLHLPKAPLSSTSGDTRPAPYSSGEVWRHDKRVIERGDRAQPDSSVLAFSPRDRGVLWLKEAHPAFCQNLPNLDAILDLGDLFDICVPVVASRNMLNESYA